MRSLWQKVNKIIFNDSIIDGKTQKLSVPVKEAKTTGVARVEMQKGFAFITTKKESMKPFRETVMTKI